MDTPNNNIASQSCSALVEQKEKTPLLSRWLPWECDFVPALVYICLGRENMSAAYLISGDMVWLGESELPEVWEILGSAVYR